jgi:6-phosphogluconolactonase
MPSRSIQARLLVAVGIMPLPPREGNNIGTLTAGLSVYRMGSDGKFDFVRKYGVETGSQTRFWSVW